MFRPVSRLVLCRRHGCDMAATAACRPPYVTGRLRDESTLSKEEEQGQPVLNVAHTFRNTLFWRWAREMPRPLGDGFLKTLQALGTGANAAGQLRFRAGDVITLKQIAAAAMVDVKDARRYLAAAEAAGVVRVEGERKRGLPTLYVLCLCSAPDWSAAVERLEGSRRKRGHSPPWHRNDAPATVSPSVDVAGRDGERGAHPPYGPGGAPPTSGQGRGGPTPLAGRGAAPPPSKGDAPPHNQAVPKEQAHGKAVGDGRRPSTGSRGHTLPGPAVASEEHRDKGSQVAAIGLVIGLLPARLRGALPHPVPKAVTRVIASEFARGITADRLADRAERRWRDHGYELDDDTQGGGSGIQRPVGVAVALLRAGGCPHPRCDDGTDMDTGEMCRTCEREAEDRRKSRRGQSMLGWVPAPASPSVDSSSVPSLSYSAEMRSRDGCERASRSLPSDGLCRICRNKGAT